MIKINTIIKEDLLHYITARIDIKNSGKSDNQIKFLNISDEDSKLYFPNWFKHEDGIGAVIESAKGTLDLKIRCINEGTLSIRLRGIYARGPNNTIIPIFINFNKVIVNGVQLIKDNILVSHDNFHECHFNVGNGDIVFIHLEWSPFTIK